LSLSLNVEADSPKPAKTKFEIRISKSQTISKLEIPKSKTQFRSEFVWNIRVFVI
jgi:hypothetical protein